MMNKEDIYKNEIDALKKHLSGEKTMTKAELEELRQDIEVDIPYTDDWISHGYSSYEEWYIAHEDFIDKLDEVLKLYKKIKEVEKTKEQGS